MQKSFEIVAVAQPHAKTIQNRPLAAVDGGLIGTHRGGQLAFSAFLPKQLFDQSPLLTRQGANGTPQIVIRRVRPIYLSRR